MQTQSTIRKVALSASLVASLQCAETVVAADRPGIDPKTIVDAKTHVQIEKGLGPHRQGDVQKMVNEFKQQREKFLAAHKDAQSDAKDERTKVREEVKSGTVSKDTREEVKQSLDRAREEAREHARKIAEEAKENAGNGHRRD